MSQTSSGSKAWAASCADGAPGRPGASGSGRRSPRPLPRSRRISREAQGRVDLEAIAARSRRDVGALATRVICSTAVRLAETDQQAAAFLRDRPPRRPVDPPQDAPPAARSRLQHDGAEDAAAAGVDDDDSLAQPGRPGAQVEPIAVRAHLDHGAAGRQVERELRRSRRMRVRLPVGSVSVAVGLGSTASVRQAWYRSPSRAGPC